jgi:peptide/nickel transport system substrate-binding protein
MPLRSAFAIAFTCCAFAQSAGAAIFRYASQIDPGTMDPHSLASLYQTRVMMNIYESLVGRDENFKLEPRLALSWTMVDGHTWRFKLRPGVKFHDGTPMTADDVVFSVLRSIDPKSLQRATYPNVTGAKKVDDLTIDIITSQPTPILPRALTNSRIMSQKWCIEHHVEHPLDFKLKEETYAARHTNGTGPFMLKSWEPDQKTVLLANPGYWGRKGNVTEAQYLVVATGATRNAGLISGEIDFVVDAGVQDVERLKSMQGFTVETAEGTGANFLGFDYAHEPLKYSDLKGKNPFRDIRVRQAFRYAIDLKAIQSKVMRGLASEGTSFVTPVIDGWDRKFEKLPPYDPEKSKALLKEAGYPDGFTVDLDCSAQAPADAMCQAVSGMLARVGIKLNFEPKPFNVLLPKLTSRDTSLYAVGWTPASVDAEGVLLPLAHTTTMPGVGDYNFGGYSNAKVDELIDKGRVEVDEGKRRALFTQALTIIDDDSAFVPLMYRRIVWVMRKNVHVKAMPNDVLDLRFVNVD